MTFRPLPRLTAAALAGLALLLTLGVWQLDRAEEKRALIAAHMAAARAEPLDDLYTAICGSGTAMGATVRAPEMRRGEEVRFFGASADGAAGWRILRLTPAPDCGCGPDSPSECLREDRSAVVEVGFETLGGERTAAPRVLDVRAPPEPNAFTPQNDPEGGEFYRFDAAALARAFGVAPGEMEADWWLTAHVPGLPPRLADMPPARHVGYALTWLGIALALVAVYLVYHHRAGRLSLRR